MFTHKPNTVYLVFQTVKGGKQERLELEPYTNDDRIRVLSEFISSDANLLVLDEKGNFRVCISGSLKPRKPHQHCMQYPESNVR